jgi:glucose/arabinose dehydrogenase
MDGPKHLIVDRDDSVLIVDTENHAIRRYTPEDGRLTLVAGTGKKGSAGLGGPPEAVGLNRPHGVYVDRDNALLISDSDNHRVLRIRR